MRRLLVLVAAIVAALGVVAPAHATRECSGFLVCIPIAGPWVLVPRAERVEFQLTCPRGFIVGGLDAELTSSSIDLGFFASVGSPVTPGVTTSRDVVFYGSFAGRPFRLSTFRPHAGCIPASGGGARIPTGRSAVVPPGKPTTRHVRTDQLLTRRALVARQGCAAGERLVSGAHAIGFDTFDPPVAAMMAAVTATRTIRDDRVVVSVRSRGSAAESASVVLQVGAVCARAGGRQ